MVFALYLNVVHSDDIHVNECVIRTVVVVFVSTHPAQRFIDGMIISQMRYDVFDVTISSVAILRHYANLGMNDPKTL